MKIKINNSKLSIVELNFTKGDTKVSGIDKNKLRYQRILLTSPGSHQFTVLPATSDTVSLPSSVQKARYSEAWAIEKDTTKATKEKYTGFDKDVMLKWMKVLYPSHLDTAELLCHACGYGNVTKAFYESYGTDMIRDFYRLIDSITSGMSSGTKKSDKKFPCQYTAPKYNIYRLLKDMVEAGDVKIYTDPDLIGKYKRITRGVKTAGTLVPDKWCEVIGIVGNKTRANLSLSYKSTISVPIPANSFGITGPKDLECIRSYCIVKDGIAWSTKLGIKTKNKSLIRKLYGSGIIEMGLVYDDEYLLDLEKLPVISVSDTKNITSWNLAKAEVAVEYARIGSMWASRKAMMERKKLSVCPKKMDLDAISPEEAFLHSLGIYGDKYIPKTTALDVTKSYESFEVEGIISQLPKDPSGQVINAINGSATTNAIVKAIVEDIERKHNLSGKTYQETMDYWENEKMSRIKNLRDLKFRLILGKTLKFSDNRGRKIENVSVKYPVVGLNYVNVFWKVYKTKFEI
jgi:hypothetical protein